VTVVPDDYRAEVTKFMEGHREEIPKLYARRALKTHAVVFALQDPQTKEPFEGITPMIVYGEIDDGFVGAIRETMRDSLSLAVAWVMFGHRQKPAPGESDHAVMVTLEFLNDGFVSSWTAPVIELAIGNMKKLGPFVPNPKQRTSDGTILPTN
jgi:hypothetical protein